jgi:hypothetical protein
MQATGGRARGGPIAAPDVFEMKANKFRGPPLEITRERMLGRQRCATYAPVTCDGLANLCRQATDVLRVPAVVRRRAAAAGLG